MPEYVSKKLKLLSFSFSIVIVLYHANLVFLNHYELPTVMASVCDKALDRLAAAALSYFFMVSGYLLYRDASRENAMQKIRRRVNSLLVPLFVWNLIYLALELLTKSDNENLDLSIQGMLYHFTLEPYDGPLWYIFAVFMLSLPVFFVMVLKHRKKLVLFLSALLCLLALLISGGGLLTRLGVSEETPLSNWFVRFFRYLPSYIIGCLIGLYWPHVAFVKAEKKTRIINSLVVLGILIAMCLVPASFNWLVILFTPLTPVLVWFSIAGTLSRNSFSMWIKGSFLIYATHTMVISVVFRLTKRPTQMMLQANIPESVSWVLFVTVVAVSTYVFSRLIAYFLERFKLNRITMLLTGNRI